MQVYILNLRSLEYEDDKRLDSYSGIKRKPSRENMIFPGYSRSNHMINEKLT